MSVIPEEFLITRQGKQFVLYAGLLNEAHNQGVRSIDTELKQVPSPDNGNVAISTAKVTMVVDDEHSTVRESLPKTFTGIGDASPENVGKNIVLHIIRMSETRAKARALRDAINVGMTALEELSEEESAARTTQAQGATTATTQGAQRTHRVDDAVALSEVRTAQRQASTAANPRPGSDKPVTDKQRNYLEQLVLDSFKGGMERFEEKVGKKIGELSRAEASQWIDKLSGKGG